MREKLSSVFYMWVAFAFGIIAILFMFAPTMLNEDLYTASATDIFWNVNGIRNGAWPSFIGYMLILAGAIASAVIALPFVEPSAKVEKIVLISSIACMVVGLVAIGLMQIEYNAFNAGDIDFGLDRLKYLWGWYVTMIAGAIAVAFDCVAVKLDW